MLIKTLMFVRNIYDAKFFIILLIFFYLVSDSKGLASEFSCSSVKNEYFRRRMRDQFPENSISGSRLKVCSGKETCCTEMMERTLSVESRQQFDTSLKHLLNPLSTLLAKKRAKFDDHFRLLLNISQASFDDMFKKAYGILYQQNSALFTDLYDNLRLYYIDGSNDLQEVMDDFFKKLYQRMFTVYNQQYQFNPRYLLCVTDHMNELQPFGDVPTKLTSQIKRSFVALRTFVQGLSVGSEIVQKVLKINPSIHCVHELMKMTHCSLCSGIQGTQPCLSYCLDVQNACLYHLKSLSKEWILFVEAMVGVGDRLEGPFNIENVVNPIKIKISNAVMNFQEAGREITKKVFQGCGQPSLGRGKREVKYGELDLESLDFNKPKESEGENALSLLIREIKTKVKNSKNFWDELPSKMCKDTVPDASANCWTGTKIGKYEGEVQKEMTIHQRFASDMNEQMFKLTMITNKLQEAYHGRDVTWIDEKNWLENKSGKVKSKYKANDSEEEEEGSGYDPYMKSENGRNSQYPPDDEDADLEYSGNGPYHEDNFDRRNNFEGSGNYGIHSPGNPNDNFPTSGFPKPPPPPPNQNPGSGFPAVKSPENMSLSRAISVYLLPAFIMFIGNIG